MREVRNKQNQQSICAEKHLQGRHFDSLEQTSNHPENCHEKHNVHDNGKYIEQHAVFFV